MISIVLHASSALRDYIERTAIFGNSFLPFWVIWAGNLGFHFGLYLNR